MIQVTKKISLDYLGEDWKDCYLEFRIPTIKEVREATGKGDDSEYGIMLMEKLFIGGKGLDEQNKVVEVVKGDLEDLPITLVNDSFKKIVETDPN